MAVWAWIPAPRFHGDKFRGNDGGGCQIAGPSADGLSDVCENPHAVTLSPFVSLRVNSAKGLQLLGGRDGNADSSPARRDQNDNRTGARHRRQWLVSPPRKRGSTGSARDPSRSERDGNDGGGCQIAVIPRLGVAAPPHHPSPSADGPPSP